MTTKDKTNSAAPTEPAASAQSSSDTKIGASSALELLAKAGDQAARNEIGYVTPGTTPRLTEDLKAGAHGAGFVIGEAAPRDVYLDRDGKVHDGTPEGTSEGAPATGGFAGTQLASKGAVVTGEMVTALAAAGVVSSK